MRSRWMLVWLVGVLVGIAIAGRLALLGPLAAETVCGTGSGCAIVSTTPWALPFGVRLAALGAGFELAYLVLGVVAWRGLSRSPPSRRTRWFRLASATRIGFAVWLLGVQAIGVGIFCSICVGVEVLTVLTSTTALVGVRGQGPGARGWARGLIPVGLAMLVTASLHVLGASAFEADLADRSAVRLIDGKLRLGRPEATRGELEIGDRPVLGGAAPRAVLFYRLECGGCRSLLEALLELERTNAMAAGIRLCCLDGVFPTVDELFDPAATTARPDSVELASTIAMLHGEPAGQVLRAGLQSNCGDVLSAATVSTRSRAEAVLADNARLAWAAGIQSVPTAVTADGALHGAELLSWLAAESGR